MEEVEYMFSIQIATTAMTAATTAAPTRAYGIALPTSAHLTVTDGFCGSDLGADLGGRGVKTPARIVATVPGIPVWRPPTC